MRSGPVSRRGFLGFVGTALGYAVLQPGTALAADSTEIEEREGVAGVVDHVEPTDMYLASPGDDSLVVVRTDGNTEIWREGSVDLSVFGHGDEVLALGRWDGRDFAASYVTSIYRNLEGVVESRNGSELQVASDVLVLVPETLPIEDPQVDLVAKPVSDLGPGDRIFAGGRLSGATGQVVVLRVGAYGT